MGFAGLLKSNKKIIINSKHVKCKWPVFCTVDGLPYLYKLCEQVLVIHYLVIGREGGRKRERREAWCIQYTILSFSEDKGYDSSSEDTDEENQSTYERFKRRVTKELKINNS